MQAHRLQERSRELEHLSTELIRVNKMKSEFLANVSHEFRTPLGTILSSVSLIARYNAPGDDEKRHKHIERIKSAVTNLTEILNDFLSLEKLEEGVVRCNPAPFDLSGLVVEVAEDMRGVTKKGQEIQTQYKGFVDLEYEVHGDNPMPGVISSFAYMRGVLQGMGYQSHG